MQKYRFDIQQNTEEWDAVRVGKFSASTCADLLMDKSTKGYQNLINKIIEERITGQKTESRTFKGNEFTERGHALEPVARVDYEFRSFNDVDLVGVVELNDWVLCSPDGLIRDEAVHQIKCPIFSTQVKYLKLINKHHELSDNEKLKKIDYTYYKQEQFELYVTGRKYAVWTSYHPSLKSIDLKIERDDDMILNISNRITEAKEEIVKEISVIKSY